MSYRHVEYHSNHSLATGVDRAVLLQLCMAADDKTGRCWPGIDRIRARAGGPGGLSRRAVRRSLEVLEMAGDISRYVQQGGDDRTPADERPNLYVVHREHECVKACGVDAVKRYLAAGATDNSVSRQLREAKQKQARENRAAREARLGRPVERSGGPEGPAGGTGGAGAGGPSDPIGRPERTQEPASEPIRSESSENATAPPAPDEEACPLCEEPADGPPGIASGGDRLVGTVCPGEWHAEVYCADCGLLGVEVDHWCVEYGRRMRAEELDEGHQLAEAAAVIAAAEAITERAA